MNGLFQVAGGVFPELAKLQQLLDEASSAGSAGIREITGRTFPPVNVGTTDDSVEVIAFVPGVASNDIDITVDRGLLSIAGQRSTDAAGKGRSVSGHRYAQERFSGAFRRVVSLPEDADPAKVDASLRDGVLHIRVAKRESSKPRRIAIG